MIHKSRFLKLKLQISVLSQFSLKRSFGYMTKRIKYDYTRFQRPENLKELNHQDFHEYHKEVFKKVYDSEMPENILNDEDFLVYERDPEPIAHFYYNYYLHFLGGLFCAAGLFFVYWGKQREKIQKEEKVPWNEAVFLQGLRWLREREVLRDYYKLKEESGIKFTNREIALIYHDPFVS